MDEKLQQVADNFLKKIKAKIPAEKADKPFVIGVVGMIASGKTTFCWELVKNLKGAVLVQSHGARMLLKQSGLEWGQNVKDITFYATEQLIKDGYTVVFDGDHVDKNKRENTQKKADELGIKFYLIHIEVSPKTSEKRLDIKYAQSHEENFWDYWLETDAEDMKQNMRDRIPEHEAAKQENIQYFAEVDNEGSIEDLKNKAREIAEKIKG